MTRKMWAIAFLLAAAAPKTFAQRHEIGLTLGGFSSAGRSGPAGATSLSTGTALQANYGFRIRDTARAAFLAEVHLLASPLRDISSVDPRASRDVASLYVVPGLRVKFLPARRISPYVAAGGGYALYEQSMLQLNGRPNTAPRLTNRGVVAFGGGADFPLWRFVGGRVEVRDFYTGNPAFNTPVSGRGQHNIVVGGGFVLRIGESER